MYFSLLWMTVVIIYTTAADNPPNSNGLAIQLFSKNRTVRVEKRSRFKVSCSATGKPHPDIYWIVEGKKFDRAVLELHLLSKNTTATCHAENDKKKSQKKVDIIVNESKSRASKHVKALLSEDNRLTIKWNGHDMDDSILQADHYKLSLVEVGQDDSRKLEFKIPIDPINRRGKYSFKVPQALTSGSSYKVQLSADFISHESFIGKPINVRTLPGQNLPVIKFSPATGTVFVERKSFYNISCYASGKPPPDVYWMVEGVELRRKTLALHNILKNTTAVCRAKLNDVHYSREVEIVVKSNASNAQKHHRHQFVQISSQGRPSAPNAVTVSVVNGSVIIQWEPPKGNHENVIRYEVLLHKENSASPETFRNGPKELSMTFPKGDHLSVEVEYSVSVVAWNQHGKGVPSGPHEFTIPE